MYHMISQIYTLDIYLKAYGKSAVKIYGKSAAIKITFYNALQLDEAMIYMLIYYMIFFYL